MKVILITLDCVRADYLDGSRGLTPQLDRLRAEGTTFAQAFSQSQNTLSSHLSLLTSNYLFQHGVYSNHEVKELPAHALPHRLTNSGWDVEAFASVEFLARALADQIGSIDRRFNLPTAPLWSRGWQRLRGYPSRLPGSQTLRTGLSWLGRTGARDAFLWLHAFDAHMVYSAPKKLLHEETRRTDAQISCREALEATGWYHTDHPTFDGLVTPEHFPARYRAAIRYLDAELGRFVAELKARGLWDDVMLVVTSDHGECLLGDHGLYCNHQKLFDETVHVPLWIRFPGGAHAGAVIDGLVELVDVAPTIARVAGFEETAYMGRDLGDIAAGEAPARDFVLAEHVHRILRAVRDREHLLVERAGGDAKDLPLETCELFLRDGTPAPENDTGRAIAARLRGAATALHQSAQAEVARAWSAGAEVGERISSQLRELGYG